MLKFWNQPNIHTHRSFQTDIETFQSSDEGKLLQMFIDDKTLIVIDEAHKFRTETSLGSIVLEKIINGDFNGKNPGVLPLTATPIGTGFENLQRLYKLSGLENPPDDPSELRDKPGFINVTLPFIMDKFGLTDDDGNTYLNFGKEKKYYARRRQMIVPYDDGNEEIYSAIDDLDFREFKEETSLDSFGLGIEPVSVDHMTLSRLDFLKPQGHQKRQLYGELTT